MAQRQRAGLITPRTQDRDLLPVYLQFDRFTEAGGGMRPLKPLPRKGGVRGTKVPRVIIPGWRSGSARGS
jgi:hypothetical protein